MSDYLYRVRVVKYPTGSFQPVPVEIDAGIRMPTPGWCPPGWSLSDEYVERLGTSAFVWPTTKRVYASRSSAVKRAMLIESFGAQAVVERSSRITWPEEPDVDYGEPAVAEDDDAEVVERTPRPSRRSRTIGELLSGHPTNSPSVASAEFVRSLMQGYFGERDHPRRHLRPC